MGKRTKLEIARLSIREPVGSAPFVEKALALLEGVRSAKVSDDSVVRGEIDIYVRGSGLGLFHVPTATMNRVRSFLPNIVPASVHASAWRDGLLDRLWRGLRWLVRFGR